jgi:hypothetical protein
VVQTVSATRILLAGGDSDERQWLAMVIGRDSRLLLVGEAGGWQEVLDFMPVLSPHVVLLDLETLGNVPTDGIIQLAQEYSRTALVGLSQGEECRAEVLPGLDLVMAKDVPFNSLLGVVLEVSNRVCGGRGESGRTPAHNVASREQRSSIAADQTAEPPDATLPENPQAFAGPPAHDAPETSPTSALIASLPSEAGPPQASLATDFEQYGVGQRGAGSWELRRGTIKLTAHPFRSFRSMLAFQGALQQIDGVTNSKICLIHDGTLHMSVEYRGMVPIEERLEGLKQFEPSIGSTDSGTIDVHLGRAASRVTSLQVSSIPSPMDYVLVS